MRSLLRDIDRVADAADHEAAERDSALSVARTVSSQEQLALDNDIRVVGNAAWDLDANVVAAAGATSSSVVVGTRAGRRASPLQQHLRHGPTEERRVAASSPEHRTDGQDALRRENIERGSMRLDSPLGRASRLEENKHAAGAHAEPNRWAYPPVAAASYRVGDEDNDEVSQPGGVESGAGPAHVTALTTTAAVPLRLPRPLNRVPSDVLLQQTPASARAADERAARSRQTQDRRPQYRNPAVVVARNAHITAAGTIPWKAVLKRMKTKKKQQKQAAEEGAAVAGLELAPEEVAAGDKVTPEMLAAAAAVMAETQPGSPLAESKIDAEEQEETVDPDEALRSKAPVAPPAQAVALGTPDAVVRAADAPSAVRPPDHVVAGAAVGRALRAISTDDEDSRIEGALRESTASVERPSISESEVLMASTSLSVFAEATRDGPPPLPAGRAQQALLRESRSSSTSSSSVVAARRDGIKTPSGAARVSAASPTGQKKVGLRRKQEAVQSRRDLSRSLPYAVELGTPASAAAGGARGRSRKAERTVGAAPKRVGARSSSAAGRGSVSRTSSQSRSVVSPPRKTQKASGAASAEKRPSKAAASDARPARFVRPAIAAAPVPTTAAAPPSAQKQPAGRRSAASPPRAAAASPPPRLAPAKHARHASSSTAAEAGRAANASKAAPSRRRQSSGNDSPRALARRADAGGALRDRAAAASEHPRVRVAKHGTLVAEKPSTRSKVAGSAGAEARVASQRQRFSSTPAALVADLRKQPRSKVGSSGEPLRQGRSPARAAAAKPARVRSPPVAVVARARSPPSAGPARAKSKGKSAVAVVKKKKKKATAGSPTPDAPRTGTRPASPPLSSRRAPVHGDADAAAASKLSDSLWTDLLQSVGRTPSRQERGVLGRPASAVPSVPVATPGAVAVTAGESPQKSPPEPFSAAQMLDDARRRLAERRQQEQAAATPADMPLPPQPSDAVPRTTPGAAPRSPGSPSARLQRAREQLAAMRVKLQQQHGQSLQQPAPTPGRPPQPERAAEAVPLIIADVS